ncbi:MerR family transcriptional regulator [Lacticaseibacillus songhuajiangensis]|jgi:DNA-binding transcriptional MerR regulator|uniref:MerR family transcriptional regulator n=1 Tax=Lacticaseibacillus songhuajiangensis TaxID=1296539 RepID=UPI000F7720A1|nr:MerR family transcriptional regulator [Lacticaseibacillus songhuajiangensis]
MAEKQYRIGEFAAKVGLSTYTLRYYEQEGLLLPQRDDNGQRYYTEADVRWLIFILHLKGTGMSMAQLKTYVRLRAQGDATIPERLALLRDVRSEAQAQIRALQNNLAVLSHKVDWYQGKVDSTIAADESFEEYLHRLELEDKNND